MEEGSFKAFVAIQIIRDTFLADLCPIPSYCDFDDIIPLQWYMIF